MRSQKNRHNKAERAFGLIVTIFLVSCCLSAKGQTPPTPAFDAARAFAYLEKQVAFGPRVPNTETHKKCRDWLIAKLEKSAKTVERQDFTFRLPGGDVLKMTNIAAEFNPSAKKQIMLCAHWDTRPTADEEPESGRRSLPIAGANDGASGVAVLLELAKFFAAKPLPKNVGVQIVLFDGEDYGPNDGRMYLGAKAYAKHPVLPKPDYAILIDMIGDKDLAILREGYSQSKCPEINDKIWKAAAELGLKQFKDEEGMSVTDDHLPLQDAGWKAVDLIDTSYLYWHTLGDTPDKCSPASLKVVGDVLTLLLYSEQ